MAIDGTGIDFPFCAGVLRGIEVPIFAAILLRSKFVVQPHKNSSVDNGRRRVWKAVGDPATVPLVYEFAKISSLNLQKAQSFEADPH